MSGQWRGGLTGTGAARRDAIGMSSRPHRLAAAAAVLVLTACGRGAPPETGLLDVRGPVAASGGMVVSSSAIASEVGRWVLQTGGNAVDAAIATGFALAVTYPTAGNIGGGGFMVIRFPDGTSTALDFRERAPRRAHPGMFLDENGVYSFRRHHQSHLAVGVPGTVAGFARAHELYGGIAWRRTVEPAVRLARDGFTVSPSLARSLAGVLPSMGAYPASVQSFSKQGVPYEAGEELRQPDLARTLVRIRDHGRDGFYRGPTARLLVDEMRRNGGLISSRDLVEYEAVEREPVRGSFRDFEIISMPPPSSGGTALVQMLNILEGYDLRRMGHNSPRYLHHLAEAMRRAFRDRATYLADADFANVPLDRLMSKDYAAGLREGIDPVRATRSHPTDVDQPFESEETTHYSVVDASGMAVSVTYTLEFGYGSRIVVPGAGFLLNNEMGDFNAQPGLTDSTGLVGTEPNLARGGQRMLSSMTPTILTRDGALVAVIGSPGGRTIINTVLQVALNVMEFGMGIQEAVDAPRMHHQWLPDQLRLETPLAVPGVIAELEGMGHRTLRVSSQGAAHAIMVDAVTATRYGAPDPRREDAGARGYN